MQSKTNKDLWEEDLKIFENDYKKHMDEYCDYMSINPKDLNFGKTVNNDSKRKIVIKSK